MSQGINQIQDQVLELHVLDMPIILHSLLYILKIFKTVMSCRLKNKYLLKIQVHLLLAQGQMLSRRPTPIGRSQQRLLHQNPTNNQFQNHTMIQNQS